MIPTPGFYRNVAARFTGEYDKSDRGIFELIEPLFFYSAFWQCWFMVPIGFWTNYASVPRAPIVYWWYGDRCWNEPALHDFPYTVHGIWRIWDLDAYLRGAETPEFIPFSRDQSDDLFLEACLLNKKTPDGMDYTMHKAVSWFGGGSWKDKSNIQQPDHINEIMLPP